MDEYSFNFMDEETLNFSWEFDLKELWLIAESLKTTLERQTKLEDPSARIYYILRQKNLAKSLMNTMLESLENEGIELKSLKKDIKEDFSSIMDTLGKIIDFRTITCLRKEEIRDLNFGLYFLKTLCTREEEPELYHILIDSRFSW